MKHAGLTRRTILTATGVVGVQTASFALPSDSSGHILPRIAPRFAVPLGACDSHVHVVGDRRQFPMSPGRDYTPPPATADQLRAMLDVLHLDRAVIVTPTVYGADNAATIDAIKRIGQARARGVAIIDSGASGSSLDALAAAGIAGVRLFLGGDMTNTRAAADHVRHQARIAADREWHLDIAASPDIMSALVDLFVLYPVQLVFDYFAWLADGPGQAGFETIISLIKSGRGYVKLAEPYRLSKRLPDYANLIPLVRAFVTANPERVLWGSGWPHVDSGNVPGRAKVDIAADLPEDAGHLLNLLAAWVPDEASRKRILVDNPARLYRF